MKISVFCEGPDDIKALARIAQGCFSAKRVAPKTEPSIAAKERVILEAGISEHAKEWVVPVLKAAEIYEPLQALLAPSFA